MGEHREVSAEKTKTVVCSNEGSVEIVFRSIHGKQLKRLDSFKHLRAMSESTGGKEKAVMNWMSTGWKKVIMVVLDKKLIARTKIYTTVKRPVLLHWAENWLMTSEVKELGRTGMKMRKCLMEISV